MGTFLIFMTWLAMEVIDVYMPPGKHNVSTSLGVTQKLNSSWPLESINQDGFFVAYKLQPLEGSSVKAGEEDQYFSGLWLQRENNEVVRAWPGVKC